jgi:hypothetical protein
MLVQTSTRPVQMERHPCTTSMQQVPATRKQHCCCWPLRN